MHHNESYFFKTISKNMTIYVYERNTWILYNPNEFIYIYIFMFVLKKQKQNFGIKINSFKYKNIHHLIFKLKTCSWTTTFSASSQFNVKYFVHEYISMILTHSFRSNIEKRIAPNNTRLALLFCSMSFFFTKFTANWNIYL